MAEEGFRRKLTAILSADVEGYSRLMGDDEEATIRTLTKYRNAMTDLIQKYRGRVVDAPGDNLLAEFASVVDGVNCAVEIQRELAERNADLLDNRKMEFRIGVNLGDVVEEEGRIYGDGVNIAARVEGLAEAGGICISGRAYDQVENKLGLEYENLGEHKVKNITRPIRVYRVLSFPGAAAHRVVQAKDALGRRWHKIAFASVVVVVAVAAGVWQFYVRRPSVEPASVEKMAFPLPDKPSIAVLPFDNLSKDQSDGYIADGLSENIISSLSMNPHMLVIARNSTFVYKGKAIKVKQVAEELGVRYVLEGSVQKSDDKIRVVAQLIDAVSGYHLWSEKYDRGVKDFFQLLDEITHKIMVALHEKLIWGGGVPTVSTTSFEAWSYCVKGSHHFQRYTKWDNIKARKLFKQAIKLDPEYVRAWILLAWTHFIDARNAYGNSPNESIKQAVLIAQKASAIDDSTALLQAFWGTLYLTQRQHEKAITAGQKSIELDPNNADGYALLAQTMYYSGRPDETITLMQQARRLSPYPPAYFLIVLGLGYQGAGRYQEAVPVFKKLLDRAQEGEFSLLLAHYVLAGIYGEMGEYRKAREHVSEVRKIYPGASLELIRTTSFFKDPDQLERVLESFRAAGLK